MVLHFLKRQTVGMISKTIIHFDCVEAPARYRQECERHRDQQAQEDGPAGQRRVLLETRKDFGTVVPNPAPVDPRVTVIGCEHVSPPDPEVGGLYGRPPEGAG